MKIVIIGGGPVGLYTAIQLKKLKPMHQITVLEKRGKPTRKQIVLLDKISQKSIPKSVHEALFTKGNGCYIEPPAIDPTATCYLDPLDRAAVQLADLETALETYAKNQGITVIRNVNPKVNIDQGYVDVGKLLPYDVLIGADGSNSQVAQAIGCKKITLAKDSYGLIVLLKGNLQRSRRKPSDRSGPKQDAWRTFRTKQGQDLYIGLTIPKELAHKPLSPAVKLTILKTCALSGTPCSLKDAETTVIQIKPFRTSCWSKVINGKLHVLVGDAAISTHFFTGSGVNNGFRMADRLAKHLEDGTPLDYSDLADQVQKSVGSVVNALEEHDRICQMTSRPELERRVDQLLGKVGLRRNAEFSKPELCLILGDRV